MEKSIATFKFREDNTHLAADCMVCGEPTEIQNIKYPFGICNKCRAAILKMHDTAGESNIKTVQLPERVWIVERTPFCGDEITEYVVEECTYVSGKLSSIQVRSDRSLYKIDIEDFLHYHRDSSICFSYEEALRKIEELAGE